MTTFSIDTSEVRAFAAHLDGAGDLLASKVDAVVSKGALNIKNQLVDEMAASRHFGGMYYLQGSISYDLRGGGAFGGGFSEAEIGPARGAPGSLANIAYFGSSRGGGTVADPEGALNAEEPNFVDALEALMESSVR